MIKISDLKQTILKELTEIFPGNESYSITKLILEHFGYPEIRIIAEPDVMIAENIRVEIKKIVDQLHKNKPIQYILGSTEFFEAKILVNESVLIPRPETEELVMLILQEVLSTEARILDIGTGSGCIAIALAMQLKNANVAAIDVDPGAIQLAKENAKANAVDITFYTQSVIDLNAIAGEQGFDIIVSNPPYVTEQDKELMLHNVTKYEPHLALFAPSEDPLFFYRHIINFAKNNLNEEGAVWVEINEGFGEATRSLFIENGFTNSRLLKDIHGKDRFIKATRK